MPYTLAKFFLWGLLMALGGGIIGWLLRSLTSRAEVARARSSTVDVAEVGRLRGRLANLEPVVAERDRLRMELADVRGKSAGALGFASTDANSLVPDDLHSEIGDEPVAGAAAELTADVGTAEGAAVSDAAGGADGDAPSEVDVGTSAADDSPDESGVDEEDEPPAAELDLDAAKGVLGKKITLDDLTVVEGIGPKIAELCSGIGITTWGALAGTDVAELQSMLDAAGSRFQMHKPASWPEQAGLLAAGRWADFKTLTDSLTNGS